ncbi:catalase [Streptomyces sp. NPDC006527]|uniref:catalase n=1 Tax=Streptomyces sp. NPDC006527 TaxID=3364749 RepID=UPI0036C55479
MKFYTEEGNYDLVGNNTPVLFIKGCHQVPRLHPRAEARPVHRLAGSRQRVGFLGARPGEHPPGDLAVR